MTFEVFKETFFTDVQDFPQLEERYRVSQELAYKTLKYFDGDYCNILKKGNFEADEVLELLSNTF